MKKAILIRFLLLPVFLFATVTCYSQAIDFKHYTVTKSAGAIPEIVVKALSLKNGDEMNKGIVTDDKKTAHEKKIFLIKNDYEIFSMFRNGDILFGDPMGQYVQKVAGELLKNNPDLLSKLNFYILKYPAINAFSNNNGFIFINTGLIANLESESELAFVLAHEIAHFIKKHPMEAHLENQKIIRSFSRYRIKSNYQKLDLIGKRSRENEFEADSLGISLFLASGYNPSAIDKALSHLHYSYVPFSDVTFDTHFFNSSGFEVPACFFLDTCSKKSPITDTYDENYSHPNIFKRRNKASTILNNNTLENENDFLVSQTEFTQIREIARFDLVHLNVKNEQYGDAIYNAYALLQDYPGNSYLELNIAKALYGLTKYKNEDKYYYVAEPYEKAEGQSQQVHFFLKQLNRKQLNVLSARYIYELKAKYPAAEFLDKLETDLINEMIIKNDMDVEKFRTAEKKSPVTETPDPLASKRELQKKNENFYLQAFTHAIESDTSFIRKCNEAKKNKVFVTDKTQLSAKVKEENEKKALENIRNKGLKIKFDDVIVLDPYLEIDRDKDKIEDEYAVYDTYKRTFDEKVVETAGSARLKSTILSSREINASNDIEKYNQLCIYREMLKENMTHEIDFFYPVGAEYFSSMKSGTRSILCYTGLFDGPAEDQYYISFIDLVTGETLYWNEKNIQEGNFEKVKKYLADDFQVLIKK